MLITGGTEGIGKALVKRFAATGDEVIFVGYNSEKGSQLERELKTKYGSNAKVRFIQADLSLISEVKKLCKLIISEFTSLDIWISTAGAFFADKQLTSESIEKTFALNTLSRYVMMNDLKDILQKGRIVFVAGPEVDLKDLSLFSNESINTQVGMKALQTALHYLDLATIEQSTKTRIKYTLIHPGPTKGKALMRNANPIIKLVIKIIAQPLLKAENHIWKIVNDNQSSKLSIYNKWKQIEFNPNKFNTATSPQFNRAINELISSK